MRKNATEWLHLSHVSTQPCSVVKKSKISNSDQAQWYKLIQSIDSIQKVNLYEILPRPRPRH